MKNKILGHTVYAVVLDEFSNFQPPKEASTMDLAQLKRLYFVMERNRGAGVTTALKTLVKNDNSKLIMATQNSCEGIPNSISCNQVHKLIGRSDLIKLFLDNHTIMEILEFVFKQEIQIMKLQNKLDGIALILKEKI